MRACLHDAGPTSMLHHHNAAAAKRGWATDGPDHFNKYFILKSFHPKWNTALFYSNMKKKKNLFYFCEKLKNKYSLFYLWKNFIKKKMFTKNKERRKTSTRINEHKIKIILLILQHFTQINYFYYYIIFCYQMDHKCMRYIMVSKW